MKPKHLILMIVMNAFWAGTASAFKVLEPFLPHGTLATLRFAIAAAALLVVWPFLPGRAPRGWDILKAVVMGIVVFCLAIRLQVAGVYAGQASDAAVLTALDPLITSLSAALFLGETIPRHRWAGFGFGMAGVVLLAQPWQADFKLPGLAANLLFISSFIGEGVYTVMGKPLTARAGVLKVVAVALLGGALANVAIDGTAAWSAARQLPFTGWLVMLYLSLICTVVGYTFWFIVIKEAEVNAAAMTIFLQPVVGLLISLLWLGEKAHWGQLWGSLVIIVGLLIGLRNGAKAKAPGPAVISA